MLARRVALSILAIAVISCGDDSSPSESGDTSTGGTDTTNPSTSSESATGTASGSTTASTTDTATSGDTDTDGPPTGDDPAVIPGDRLDAQRWEADGDAALFRRIWDTQLATACNFVVADDAQLRCLPTFLDKVAYRDAGCTQPIYLNAEPSCGLEYVYERTYDQACGESSMYSTFRVETEVVTDVTEAFSVTSTGCMSPGPPTVDVHAVTAMPAAEFVAGTWTDEPRAEGLVARFADGDDNSRFLNQLRRDTDGVRCSPDRASAVCFPVYAQAFVTAAGTGNTYVDDACTELGVPVFDCPPDVVVLLDSAGCDPVRTPHTLGAEVPVADAHFGDGVTCDPTGIAAPLLYGVGPEITNLTTVVEQLEGTGAVQARRYVDSADAVLGPTVEFEASGTSCRPMADDAGAVRCVDAQTATAPSADLNPLYADDACTQALVRGPACPGPNLRYAIAAPRLWCSDPVLTEVFDVGTTFTGDTAYELIDTTCSPVGVTELALWELGAAANFDVFPEVSLVTP